MSLITEKLEQPRGSGKTEPGGARPSASPLMRKGDRYLLIGMIIGGTWAFGIFAIPFMYLAYRSYSRAQKEGTLTRPWSVTIVGAFCLIDACINTFGWGFDLFWANQTTMMETLYSGYGRLIDGAYYIDYNSGPLGGSANPTEKVLQIMCVLVMFPMRIASAWGFLKMKRWALQGMIITSYMYVMFWISYVAAVYEDFPSRFGASQFGTIGAWFVFIVYATPFVVLPYLYTVNRELFADEP